MKRIFLLMFSFLPAAAGYLLNYGMMTHMDRNWPLGIIGLAVLAVWFLFGYLARYLEPKPIPALLLGNGGALLCFLLMFVQEVVFRAYAPNILGLFPQMFFLPLLYWGSRVTAVLLGWLPTLYVWMDGLAALIMMLGAFALGGRLRRGRDGA